MGEPHASRSRGVPRRAINWNEVGGLVVEWVIAIGELVFGVLLFGLVGGFFGSFVAVCINAHSATSETTGDCGEMAKCMGRSRLIAGIRA